MILTKHITISIRPIHFKHFLLLGYKNLYVNKKLLIPIEHLPLGSHSIVEVECDICKNKKHIQYKEYINNIKKENFYCCSKCAHIKHEKICFLKHGVKNSFQRKEVKKKIRLNNKKKFGVYNFVETEEFKKKSKTTCFKNYGVNNPSQNEEIYIKQQIKGFQLKIHESTGLYYRGTYEKHFLDFCFENNISIKQGKTIKYKFNKLQKIYFSDFYLDKNNLIIEIKSTYTYKKYLKKNLAKKRYTLKQGFNFIFIIDKKYDKFIQLVSQVQ